MPDIHITVRNKIASGSASIVLDNSDYNVVFSFDDEWAEYPTKTMRVQIGTAFIDTIFEGDTVPLPKISGAGAISIGVYAGDIRTTTPALIECRDSILTAGGSPAAPSEDVYAQIMEKLNSMEGGEVSAEDIAAAVEQYLEENPVETVTEHNKLSGRDAADQHPISAITGLQTALDDKQPTGDYLTPDDKPEIIADALKAVPAQVQADFAQNDDTQTDYVRNRTHWVETVRSISKILPETVATYDDSEGIFYIVAEVALTEGNTYTVNWNGTEYSTTAALLDGIVCLGDLYTLTDGSIGTESTGEPFVIAPISAEMTGGQAIVQIFPIDGSTELTLSITGETVTEIVHQLEDKFIPASWLPTRTVVERTVLETTAWSEKTGKVYAYQLNDAKSITVTLTVDGETLTETLVPTFWGQGNVFFSASGTYISLVNYNVYDANWTINISSGTDSTPTDITITGEFYEYDKMPYQYMTSVTVDELTPSSLAGISTLLQSGITVRYQDGVIIAAFSDGDTTRWCAVWVNGTGIHVESSSNWQTGLYLSSLDTTLVNQPHERFLLTIDANGIPTITGIDDTSKVWTPGEYLPAVTEEDNGKALAVENGVWTASDGFVPKSGGALTGALTADATASPTAGQVRNIYLSTAVPSESDGNDGDVWFVYE